MSAEGPFLPRAAEWWCAGCQDTHWFPGGRPSEDGTQEIHMGACGHTLATEAQYERPLSQATHFEGINL